ncbi:MAG: hypothetical protein J6Z30_03330 [Pyramidobacter sp.]|nr:hypothetical protein [Pyramidobacter sp.]
MSDQGRKRRGTSLVELLIALPLAVVLAGGALRVMSSCLASFEKTYVFAAHPGWQSAERLFAFLDLHVRHCGLGLPSGWERSLFTDRADLDSQPPWASWKRPIDVGEGGASRVFTSSGSTPGSTLRLVAAVPPGVTLVSSFSADAGTTGRAELATPIKSETTSSLVSSSSWLVAAGWNTPLRLFSDVNQASPVLAVRQDVSLPAGARLCRLAALKVWAQSGVVFVDFNDESGAQPLFRHIDYVVFTLDTNRRLLRAKVSFGDGNGQTMELERAWRIAA